MVIVGGGHNGLVAAAYLARAGRPCWCSSGSATPGGAAVSTRAVRRASTPGCRATRTWSACCPGRSSTTWGSTSAWPRRSRLLVHPGPRGPARGLLVGDADPDATRRVLRRG